MSTQQNSTLVQAPGVITAEVGEELVLMGDDLKYYGLNHVGRRVWELLAEPHSREEVARSVASDYQVDATVVTDDVTEFVDALEYLNMLVPA